MGATLRYFMLLDDERALFRLLARRGVTVYPELVPPGYAPIAAGEDVPARLDGAAYYLALERLGPVMVHPVKRGPDRGLLAIEEIPSPVFHYERSLPNEQGELEAGRLWAELEVTDDPASRIGKPYALKALFLEIQDLFKKSWRRSEPKGFWVGPHAAAAWKRGEFRLREPGHKGGLIGVWR
jgi:hypothetical protein